jgi:2-polyprenyl-6-methoxyphenol hydroxylase-like FAD-dependent oxidoreductase
MKRKHAIVIGAGIAGVLAARVLSEYFQSVTIVERDLPDQDGASRKGIPQAPHVHNLLYNGFQIISKMFPDFFGKEFDAAKSPWIEISKDQRLLGPYGWNPIYSTGLRYRGFSRDFLDRQMLKRISTFPSIKIAYGLEVTGLLHDAVTNQIRGVKTRDRQSTPPGAAGEWEADLVINASGRTSPMPSWLAALGIQKPPVNCVSRKEGYATRTFEIHGPVPPWHQFAIIRAPPIHQKGVYFLAMEKNRWAVTLVGGPGDYPEADEKQFMEFARVLGTNTVYELIRNATPVGPIHLYRNMDNVCTYYDKVANWPQGLICLGDSICVLNPVFGQGMTTAAVGAKVLGRALARAATENWESSFHKNLINALAAPWLYSAREDIRAGQSAGEPTFTGPVGKFKRFYLGWALRALLKAMPHDKKIYFWLFQFQNIMKSVTGLYNPFLMARALFAAMFRTKTPMPADVQIHRNEETVRELKNAA